MTSLTEFFNKHEDDALKGISHKNSIIKRNIIAHMAVNGECTLSELTKQLHISVPTITKLVQELVEENIVTDNGKVETPGGRRPNIYGLANSAIYFVGVNVGRDFMGYVVTDLQNNIILEQMDPTFELLDRPQCLDRICTNIEEFVSSCGVDRGKILGLGVCMTGRVNPTTGRSYKYFTSSEESMREIIEERVGIRTLFENDTRARCYAEYSCGKAKDENDMLYLHLGRGIAIGIVMEGKLYYGKSGFAGEFGHIPFFDNEKICACGKKGCLETEVSGIAIEEKICSLIEKGVNTILREKYDRKEPIHIDDIIAAAKNDDNLSIELIEEAGEKIGKAVAFLINIFNPVEVLDQQVFAQPRLQGYEVPPLETQRERQCMGRSDADPQSGHRPLNIRFIRGDSQKAISVVAGLRFFIDPCLSKENSRACAHSKPKTSTCSTCGRTTLPCGASAERSRPFRGTRSGVSSTNSASTSTPHGSCGWSSRHSTAAP